MKTDTVTAAPRTTFSDLRKIDVARHVEKKNGLSYLSWAWAVDQLLQKDPEATWTYQEPVRFADTLMVFCSVTAFGKTMTAQLPVMDHRNKAIINPDAFAVNVAMQRCLAKAIALHGIGLYIYAGEDMPSLNEEDAAAKVLAEGIAAVNQADSDAAVKAAFASYWKAVAAADQPSLKAAYDTAKAKFAKPKKEPA